MLLVTIAADQNQVDCIGNGLTLDSLHVFQIIHTNLRLATALTETGIPLLREVTAFITVPVVTVPPGFMTPLMFVSTSSMPSK
jgi:hypothetical protein